MDQNITTIENEHDLMSRRDADAVEVRAGGRRRGFRSALLAAGALAVLAGGGFYGHYWWTAGRFFVSTDDAYLQADNVIISPIRRFRVTFRRCWWRTTSR
ncbi:MAG: hypothetical protein ABSC06_26135 [Rhodopila sp.]|jgi:membrane fusion protein (multidrug efflux system)